MPGDFIDIIEKRGYILKLDEQMWEQAAAKLGEWKKRGIDTISISVNVSTKDFYYTDLYQAFTGLVEKYDINPGLLNIEITETGFMSDMQSHMEVINKLRAYGFHIEIDDFGSGYSSLNVLKDMEVDYLKVDMKFLQQDQGFNGKGEKVLTSVIRMAKWLNMPSIVEGVETLVQSH